MALQMFACTATQTCVVNISRPVDHRRENRPIGDESVLQVDRLRGSTVHSRRLGPYFCSFWFISSMERRSIASSSCIEALSPTRSIDRSRGSIDAPREYGFSVRYS
ncbi:hypothetical protein CAJAP_09403 [Camponotus japonicus]